MTKLRLILIVVGLGLIAAKCDLDAPPIPAPDPPPPAASAAADASDLGGDDVTVASLNILHGNPLGAPDCALIDNCDAPGRVDVAMRHVESIGCPDIVAFQEVDTRVHEVLKAAVPGFCGGAYEKVRLIRNATVSLDIDQEAILTTLPVLEEHLLDLPAFPWSAHHLVLDSPLGRVDFVTTHLASSSMNPPCLIAGCKSFCAPLEDAKTCGARQILWYLGSPPIPGDSIHIVTGDFNAEPDHVVYELFTGEALFADSHLVAGNPECDDAHLLNCTSGERDEPDGLYDPAALNDRRIDYIMVRGTPTCAPVIDTAADLDADGTGTGNWANEPIDPPGSGGLLWASDHSGNQIDLHCG